MFFVSSSQFWLFSFKLKKIFILYLILSKFRIPQFLIVSKHFDFVIITVYNFSKYLISLCIDWVSSIWNFVPLSTYYIAKFNIFHLSYFWVGKILLRFINGSKIEDDYILTIFVNNLWHISLCIVHCILKALLFEIWVN